MQIQYAVETGLCFSMKKNTKINTQQYQTDKGLRYDKLSVPTEKYIGKTGWQRRTASFQS
jgi:hypothetical protein